MLRAFFVFVGLVLVFFGWVFEVARYGEVENSTQWGRGTTGVVMFVTWGVCSPRNRGRLHRWLGSLGARGTQEQEAAALAALISGRGGGVAAVLQRAVERFRVLPLSSLTAADLVSNADTGLNARVRPAALGTCDAFVSHSWRDDGARKYSRLAEHSFASGERTVWLDKACIDQSNIEESLAALPIFLCACKELLILPGATYGTRLWCIMEIFTFVQMGGERERAVILPLIDEADLLSQLGRFSAGKAQCFLPRDRHKLLATIEASFGTYGPFNEIVRAMMTDKLQPCAVKVVS